MTALRRLQSIALRIHGRDAFSGSSLRCESARMAQIRHAIGVIRLRLRRKSSHPLVALNDLERIADGVRAGSAGRAVAEFGPFAPVRWTHNEARLQLWRE